MKKPQIYDISSKIPAGFRLCEKETPVNGWTPKIQFLKKFSTFSKNYQKMFAIAKNGVKCQNFDEGSQIKVFLDPLISM